MKKSLLFGMLAAFAISALSVHNLDAQNPVKKPTTTEKKVEKKDDCCAEKKASCDKKAGGECCAEKKVAADQKKADCCAEKKVAADGTQMNADCKKDCKHGDKKCDGKKPEIKSSKNSEAEETATDK